MFSYLIGGGLVLSPFVFRYGSTQNPLRMAKESFLYFAIILALFFYNKAKQAKDVVLIPFLLLIGMAYFNTYNFESIRYWIQFQYFSIFLLLLYYLVNTEVDEKILKNCLRFIVVVNSVWMIGVSYGYEFYSLIATTFIDPAMTFSVKDAKVATGFIGQHNLDGALLGVLSPLFFKGKSKWFLPLIGYALYVSTSSMAMVTFGAALSYFVYSKYCNWKYFPFLCFILAGIIYPFIAIKGGYFSDSGRMEVWSKMIEVINLKTILLGNGLAHFGDTFHFTYLRHIDLHIFRHAHNEYLQLIYTFGLGGFALVLFALYRATKLCNDRVILSCIFAIMVNCYGNFYFHISILAFVAVVLFAIAYNNRGNYVPTMEWKGVN